MKLESFLEEKKIPMAHFADGIKVKLQSAYRYVNGQRVPEPEIMSRIVEFTDGAVQPNDFYNIREQ